LRNRYVVCYDISDPKRWRKIFDKMNGFGKPLQYSVFQCDLSLRAKFLLLDELSALIDHHEDRVVMIDTGPVEGRGRECFLFLGRGKGPDTDRSSVIV
jgi:CRISPR-associated protein Cas2